MNGQCPSCQHPLPSSPVTQGKSDSFVDRLNLLLPAVGIFGLLVWLAIQSIEAWWTDWWWVILPSLAGAVSVPAWVLRRLMSPKFRPAYPSFHDESSERIVRVVRKSRHAVQGRSQVQRADSRTELVPKL